MIRVALVTFRALASLAAAPARDFVPASPVPTAAPPAPAPSRYLAPDDARDLLLDAARAGDLNVVSGLVRAGVSMEVADAKGYTALILAAYHGHDTVVAWLITHGADPCHGDKRGNTALMGAAFKGHAASVDLLLAQECPVDQVNGVGQTALMFAALVGNDAAARILAHGADKARRDSFGRTADDWAETQGAPGVSELRPEE
jgi:ankyrin repeat protein